MQSPVRHVPLLVSSHPLLNDGYVLNAFLGGLILQMDEPTYTNQDGRCHSTHSLRAPLPLTLVIASCDVTQYITILAKDKKNNTLWQVKINILLSKYNTPLERRCAHSLRNQLWLLLVLNREDVAHEACLALHTQTSPTPFLTQVDVAQINMAWQDFKGLVHQFSLLQEARKSWERSKLSRPFLWRQCVLEHKKSEICSGRS